MLCSKIQFVKQTKTYIALLKPSPPGHSHLHLIIRVKNKQDVVYLFKVKVLTKIRIVLKYSPCQRQS